MLDIQLSRPPTRDRPTDGHHCIHGCDDADENGGRGVCPSSRPFEAGNARRSVGPPELWRITTDNVQGAKFPGLAASGIIATVAILAIGCWVSVLDVGYVTVACIFGMIAYAMIKGT
jgi:hypothetical protein